MAGINYGRVLLGGLAGGVVANACDFVNNTFLMADDMQQMAQRLSLDYDTLGSTSVAVTWVVVDFIYATIIAWTYAAVRPRLGPGPWTAMTAGLMIYAASTVILFGFTQMGIFTMPTFVKAAVLSAITATLTGLVAGKVYQE